MRSKSDIYVSNAMKLSSSCLKTIQNYTNRIIVERELKHPQHII
jgi:hypothetical protein